MKDSMGRQPRNAKPGSGAFQGIEARILLIRGERVMLDRHLASLYGVEAGQLNRAVKRHLSRFPSDFMFQLSSEEWANLKCQIGISSWGGDRRARPFAFTDQGVAMLSGVLNSPRAVRVHVAIMRAFVRLRRILSENVELASRLAEVERKVRTHDAEIQSVFDAIRGLMESPAEGRRRIGFIP